MLNIEADKLAKEKLAMYRTGPARFHIPGSQGVCYAGTLRIEKDFANTIRDHINGQKATEYWLKRRGLTQGIWKTIDWESIGRAMKELPINRRRWVSKYVSGHFATGKNMQRWKFQSTAECPRCHDQQEDKHHLLTCPDTAARERWEKSMKDLDSWLRNENTDRQIRNHLMGYLKNWNSTNATATTPGNPIPTQDDIGKQYIWDGWLSTEWREQQEQAWKRLRSRKSSRRWTSELIKKLWNVAWDMWEQRNDALHESTLNRGLILEKDINDKIRQIYSVGIGQLARGDFGLMKNPLEHQIQLPLHTKQQWVESIAAALHRKQIHEHGSMLAEQRLMETWVVRNPIRRPPVQVSQRRPMTSP